MSYKEVEKILKEHSLSYTDMRVLEPYILRKENIFGFAEIKVDNFPKRFTGQTEIRNDLRQMGIVTYVIHCYESKPAEASSGDGLEYYNMKFVFVGSCKSFFDAKSKLNQSNYILEIHKTY